MAHDALALLNRKMDNLGIGGHAFCLAVAGEAKRLPAFDEEFFVDGAVGIMAFEAGFFLEGAMLELFVAKIVVAALADAGELLLDDRVVLFFIVEGMAALTSAG